MKKLKINRILDKITISEFWWGLHPIIKGILSFIFLFIVLYPILLFIIGSIGWGALINVIPTATVIIAAGIVGVLVTEEYKIKGKIDDIVLQLKNAQTSSEAVDKLINMGKPTIPAIRKVLKENGDRGLRLNAAVILCKLVEDEDGLSVLKKELTSNDPVRRRLTIQASKKADDKRLVPELIELLKRENDKRNQEEIIKLLGELKDKRAVPILSEILRDNKYTRFCNNILEALAKIGGEEATTTIICALDNEEMRGYAIQMLGFLGMVAEPNAKLGLKKLVEYLNDNDSTIRNNIVDTLTKLGDKEAIRGLEIRLGIEPDSNVKKQIENALKELNDLNPRED